MIIKQNEIDLALKEACKFFYDESRILTKKERNKIQHDKIINRACIRIRRRFQECFWNMETSFKCATDSMITFKGVVEGLVK